MTFGAVGNQPQHGQHPRLITMNQMNDMNFTTPGSGNHECGSLTALWSCGHRCVSILHLWLPAYCIDIHDIHDIHGIKIKKLAHLIYITRARGRDVTVYQRVAPDVRKV